MRRGMCLQTVDLSAPSSASLTFALGVDVVDGCCSSTTDSAAATGAVASAARATLCFHLRRALLARDFTFAVCRINEQLHSVWMAMEHISIVDASLVM